MTFPVLLGTRAPQPASFPALVGDTARLLADDIDGLDAFVAARLAALPGGVLGYESRDTTFSTASTSAVDLGNLGFDVTVAGGRLLKVSVNVTSITNPDTDGRCQLHICDGDDTVLQSHTLRHQGTNAENGTSFFTIEAPAAGAITYKVRCNALADSGGETIQFNPPIWLVVEDIGRA